MKRNFVLFAVTFFMLGAISISCKKGTFSNADKVTLDSLNVTEFALELEKSVLDGDTLFYASSFDKEFLKTKLQDNSIAFSSLDASFGKDNFERYFHQIGIAAVSAIENYGDFKFVNYYVKDNEHHIVMRTYEQFTIKIDDWIVHVVDNKIKIKEGFLFNTSTTLSNDLIYYLHQIAMLKTNPEGAIPHLVKATGLLMAGREKEALKILEKNKVFLKQYPSYWKIYIMCLQELDVNKYIQRIDALKDEGYDSRSLLLHKLLFYVNSGNSELSRQMIEQLIPFTGDDPIYLFLYGKALTLEGDYKNGMLCFQNLETAMPLLWDVWCEKLECYYHLGDVDNFKKSALLGYNTFDMTEAELLDFINLHFPAMKKIEFFAKNS